MRIILLVLFLFSLNLQAKFKITYPDDCTRQWLSPHLWTNEPQHWSVKNGKIHCRSADYTVIHLLSHRLNQYKGGAQVEIEIDIKKLEKESTFGFMFLPGSSANYKARSMISQKMLKGFGCIAGYSHNRLFIKAGKKIESRSIRPRKSFKFRLGISRHPTHGSSISFRALEDKGHGTWFVLSDIDNKSLENIAFFSHRSELAISNFSGDGSILTEYPDRKCGPILAAFHSINKKQLRINVQMQPVSLKDNDKLQLSVKEGNKWVHIQEAAISAKTYSALFTVDNWDDSLDKFYRITYKNKFISSEFNGRIKRNPRYQPRIKAVILDGNCAIKRDKITDWKHLNQSFMSKDLLKQVSEERPDIILATLNGTTLQQWISWAWAFSEIGRNTPVIVLNSVASELPDSITTLGSNSSKHTNLTYGGLSIALLNADSKSKGLFLNKWAKDWEAADMKFVYTQSISNYNNDQKRFVFNWPDADSSLAFKQIRRALAPVVTSGSQTGIYQLRLLDQKHAVCHIQGPQLSPYIKRSGLNEIKKKLNTQTIKKSKSFNGYSVITFNKTNTAMQVDYKSVHDPKLNFTEKLHLHDIYQEKISGYLKTLQINQNNSLLELINMKTGSTVYIKRITGREFRPFIFEDSEYKLILTSESGEKREISGLRKSAGFIEIKFNN